MRASNIIDGGGIYWESIQISVESTIIDKTILNNNTNIKVTYNIITY
jgi:hypothetical protein